MKLEPKWRQINLSAHLGPSRYSPQSKRMMVAVVATPSSARDKSNDDNIKNTNNNDTGINPKPRPAPGERERGEPADPPQGRPAGEGSKGTL